jgi:hypothetical protein
VGDYVLGYGAKVFDRGVVVLVGKYDRGLSQNILHSEL